MRPTSKLTGLINSWPILLVVVFGLLASRPLIFEKGYFNMHDDLQMMRQLSMEKCFLDGQFPCRWVPDMGYGYGFPLFNFYPPLPYLVGQIFRLFQFSFMDTVKLTFALSIVGSGITMYYLSKEFFGRFGGVVAAVFYMWAPYHSVDVYVRGAMNESWALIWYPLILLFSYKLLTEKETVKHWIVALSVSWAGILLSHNLMAFIFTPVFFVWCLIFWLRYRDYKRIVSFILSGVFALGLAAFFTLPAVFEQKLVHVDTLVKGYYEYIAHFASIGQLLISRYWGYGPSIWGPKDGMPLQVGHVHWVLSLFLFLSAVFTLYKNKAERRKDIYITIFLSFSIAWFASFMAHQYSTPIWQKIPPLSFVQFPWRFLTIAIFGFSFLSGASVYLLRNQKNLSILMGAFLILGVVSVNWSYFLPQTGKMGPLSDSEKFSGIAWNMQRTAGIYDYLPKTAKFNPKDPQNTLAVYVMGGGEIFDAVQGTNWAKFRVNSKSDSVVRINIFDFPRWVILLDGNPIKSFISEKEDYGRMYINIPAGEHLVSLRLANTPVRLFGNLMSLISWLYLLLYFLKGTKVAERPR